MFRMKFFKVVEICDNVTVTHYHYRPTKKEIKAIINEVKNSGKTWQLFKDGMVVR